MPITYPYHILKKSLQITFHFQKSHRYSNQSNPSNATGHLRMVIQHTYQCDRSHYYFVARRCVSGAVSLTFSPVISDPPQSTVRKLNVIPNRFTRSFVSALTGCSVFLSNFICLSTVTSNVNECGVCSATLFILHGRNLIVFFRLVPMCFFFFTVNLNST